MSAYNFTELFRFNAFRRVARSKITFSVPHTCVIWADRVIYLTLIHKTKVYIKPLYSIFTLLCVRSLLFFECSKSEAFSVFHFYSHFLAARTRHNSWSENRKIRFIVKIFLCSHLFLTTRCKRTVEWNCVYGFCWVKFSTRGIVFSWNYN